MAAPQHPKKCMDNRLGTGLLGIIGHYAYVQRLTEYNYTILLVGFIVLAVGTTFRELYFLYAHL